jgi:hypothetical protein
MISLSDVWMTKMRRGVAAEVNSAAIATLASERPATIVTTG